MGWKCHCLFVGDTESGYFGTSPKHSPERARTILQTLGFDPDIEGTKDCANLYPQKGLVIGAFEKGAYIATARIMDDLEKGEDSFFQRAMTLYPGTSLLALALHSVVGFSAFSYYKSGQLVRTFAGSEGGIIHEKGDRLPEEHVQYADSIERDGSLVFPRKIAGEVQELDLDAIGEEIVFALAARPLGIPLDQFDEDIFETEIFPFKKSVASTAIPKSKQNTQPKPFWKFW